MLTLLEISTVGILVASVLLLILTYHAFYIKSGYKSLKKALDALPGLA